MTTIPPPNESTGTQKLKQQNRKNEKAFRAKQLTDSTREQHSEKQYRFRRQSENMLRLKFEEPEENAPKPASERRHHDRRRANKPVILDTRSKHDRRQVRASEQSHSADNTGSEPAPSYGIDTEA